MSEKMDDIVSGEIDNDVELDRLAPLERSFLQDAKLANDWEETSVITDPRDRASALLDRINAERRDLNASNADPDYKEHRAQMLSDLANRLRALL